MPMILPPPSRSVCGLQLFITSTCFVIRFWPPCVCGCIFGQRPPFLNHCSGNWYLYSKFQKKHSCLCFPYRLDYHPFIFLLVAPLFLSQDLRTLRARVLAIQMRHPEHDSAFDPTVLLRFGRSKKGSDVCWWW